MIEENAREQRIDEQNKNIVVLRKGYSENGGDEDGEPTDNADR